MVNFHLHVSGPRMRALIALANGEYRHGSALTVNGLEREGLIIYKPAPSEIEGITLDTPVITPRGRTVLDLIETDIAQYLSRARSKRSRS